MNELTILAAVENIDRVTDFVNEQLEEACCPLKAQMQLDVAVDEVFSNIANYAYRPGSGPATIKVERVEDPSSIVITFIDHGKPYNPLLKEDPDISLPAEERETGGLGIFLVKKLMDDMAYDYREGQNILQIRKKL